jgi:HAD superfamily hydrolase (TIGR01662 family)
VLFDRDGTLVHDEPYNGDPDKVRIVEGAKEALDVLRRRGIAVGVITNQSGIGRGLLSTAQVEAVNLRIEQQLGPFDVWQWCPHLTEDHCTCRKPLPGMVFAAANVLGIPTHQCAVIGDIEADVHAAEAAGALGILVPTAATRPEEVQRASIVAETLAAAVTAALAPRASAAAGSTPKLEIPARLSWAAA